MMNGKYVMSKFSNVESMRQAIMNDMDLNDTERLLCIFNTMKDQVRKCSPYLYYCLLAINDSYKIGSKSKK